MSGRTLINSIATCTLLLGLSACARSDPMPTELLSPKRTYAGDNPIIDEMKHKTVLLLENKDDDPRYYCSGVWISRDTVLTARHCIAAHTNEDWQRFEEKDSVMALDNIAIDIAVPGSTTVYHGISGPNDETNDLAVVFVSGPPKHPIAALAKRAPMQGDNLHFMGHPDELTWTYTRGVVAAHRLFRSFGGQPAVVLQVSGFVYYGNSGGGAFDDYGDLVGVCSSLGEKAPGQAHYAPSGLVELFLIKHKIPYTLD